MIDEEADRQGKAQLKRIVSMLTRLIQRTDRVVDAALEYEYEYEYEYRDAEYVGETISASVLATWDVYRRRVRRQGSGRRCS